ncbi:MULTISPECIES: 4-hydroxybutyrate dehydrogenase [unclassified Clostridium]|uniref:4-hydroxybutyrate dehydrogenase n=1 Tax=unclassified Clostridium TaxID=2614128 RepID=UPI0002975F06|nr:MULTISPECIES: 4-hydroxybutyrate dehydrogenase [unclassified Clostridium]EKQ57880.1 MAG: alcohol dehydrogenase, class IV [Clostridium sp. Maddingley MBC34-26]
MKQLMLNPTIYKYDDCKTFCKEFRIGKDDLVITNKRIYDDYLKSNVNEAAVLFRENYGSGEPSDEMVEAMYENIKRISYERIIAIGGGSILDIGKLFALKNISPVVDLFDHKLEIIKEKELVLVPTTCGTGSEVTNISILELKKRNTKMGLATDELYADSAIMIPELLQCLPFDVFATSSIDAFIHAIESYLSPKATAHTKLFSIKAMEIILKGYKKIKEEGKDASKEILDDFLLASNYAGIAFGNAGCAAVHAMSYPLSSAYHVPHGEANYVMFTGIFKVYQKINPDGEIKELNKFLASLLKCTEDKVYEYIENLLNNLITKKSLYEYGVSEGELSEFADSVIEKQQRLMANNYAKLNREEIYGIYKSLYI